MQVMIGISVETLRNMAARVVKPKHFMTFTLLCATHVGTLRKAFLNHNGLSSVEYQDF